MNPLAEEALKIMYNCIEYIISIDELQQTSAKRSYFLGVINTLLCTKLITLNEFNWLIKEMERILPYKI